MFWSCVSHLTFLCKAIESAHPRRGTLVSSFLRGYELALESHLTTKNDERAAAIAKILARLEDVRQRGRKRSMVG